MREGRWRLGVAPGRADTARNGPDGPDVGAHTRGMMPIGEAHGCPPDFPDPQTQGSTVWEPESDDPKARGCATRARRPILDEGARVRPDPWPNLGIVTIYPDTCRGSASLLEGEQNIDLPHVGSEQDAAQPAPQNSSLSFSPLPPVPPPPDTLARENPPGEGAATERRATEDRRPEASKPLKLQAENLQEAGLPLVPGDSPAFPDDMVHTLSGLLAWPRTRTPGNLNPRALTRTNEGERCRSRALHQPWPREPLASNLLARLKGPSPLSSRRWCPGRKAWPIAKSRGCRERRQACTRAAA